jgi:UDP-N-acetylglucosamine enolpyruvyl transferase
MRVTTAEPGTRAAPSGFARKSAASAAAAAASATRAPALLVPTTTPLLPASAAIEPEIMDLIAILQKMGAIISVEPNRVIVIEGVETLRGYTHTAIVDRNEAASWAAAALATKGDIIVGGAKQQELMTFLNVIIAKLIDDATNRTLNLTYSFCKLLNRLLI